MQFLVAGRFDSVSPRSFPHVTLRRDDWDDFHYKTLFDATLVLSSTQQYELGQVKILQRGQTSGQTPLESSFEVLGADYCSLGQELAYYEVIAGVPTEHRRAYLSAMRDAAANAAIEDDFKTEDGWSTSLLRFGQATNALEAGRRLLRGESVATGVLSFAFEGSPGGLPLRVPFSFDDAADLPGRCNVLIGYNGVGKTRLLADLAVAASGYGASKDRTGQARLTGDDTTFGAVVAVSYSAFDTFKTPTPRSTRIEEAHGRTEVFGYVYCGLRKFVGSREASKDAVETDLVQVTDAGVQQGQILKTIDEIEQEFAVALREAGLREEHSHLTRALDLLAQEPSFGRIGVDLRDLGRGLEAERALEGFKILSTGHKIVVNIVTQLAAHLRQRSLVLIDEPETHLHPPLMAALLKAIQSLLDAYDSFAVIATHSPVVVQEVPARYVQVLERLGNQTTVRPASIETYGEGVGVITRQIFSLDSSATDYQGVLADLASRLSLDEIDDLFDNGMSNQARALVQNYLSRGN